MALGTGAVGTAVATFSIFSERGEPVGVTNHADQRIRQRVGVPRSAVRRLAVKAKAEGIERKDTSGSLRRYLDALYHYNDKRDSDGGYVYNDSSIYIYGEKVWVFVGNALVTVLNLPNRYKNAANALGRKSDEL